MNHCIDCAFVVRGPLNFPPHWRCAKFMEDDPITGLKFGDCAEIRHQRFPNQDCEGFQPKPAKAPLPPARPWRVFWRKS